MGRPLGLTEDLFCRMNEDLQLVLGWASENGFLLNVKKSFSIPISRNNLDFKDLPELFIGDTPISLVNKARNLGVVVNSKLTCVDHVNKTVGKIYAALRGLRVSAQYTPLEVRSRLAKQLLMPIFMYANVVYCKLDSASSHKIQVAFNSVLRYVYDLKTFEHVSESAVTFLNCTFENYCDIANLTFLHRLINKEKPAYLFEKVSFLRSSRSRVMLAPQCNFLNSSRYFFVHTIRRWNNLPESLRKIDSEPGFKRSLFTKYKTQKLL